MIAIFYPIDLFDIFHKNKRSDNAKFLQNRTACRPIGLDVNPSRRL
ncbi:hypothetical protein [Haemophilus paracuniculus]|nr:hypothetical protein [Haemophilus paracuniculus]